MKTALLPAILVLSTLPAWAAAASRAEPQFTLAQLTHSAGIIFAGRVKSVQYLPANSSTNVAIVRIRFQVEQGLRGVRSGKELTIRQWAGLWDAGERYRVGERVLLFLYPASKLGLTSAVAGSRGRFALDHRGQVLLGRERAILLHGSLQQRHDRVPLREFVRGLQGIRGE